MVHAIINGFLELFSTKFSQLVMKGLNQSKYFIIRLIRPFNDQMTNWPKFSTKLELTIYYRMNWLMK